MHKGLRITFSATNVPKQFLRNFIQKKAQQLELEGMAQLIKTEKAIRIFVYGTKDSVDNFVDFLQKAPADINFASFEVEPFLMAKDYHGVFRIVEG